MWDYVFFWSSLSDEFFEKRAAWFYDYETIRNRHKPGLKRCVCKESSRKAGNGGSSLMIQKVTKNDKCCQQEKQLIKLKY